MPHALLSFIGFRHLAKIELCRISTIRAHQMSLGEINNIIIAARLECETSETSVVRKERLLLPTGR
jgi:hypothetical protein